MSKKNKVLNIDTLSNIDISMLKKIHNDIEDLLGMIKDFKKEL